jgi:hydrogenase maturation protease
VAGGAGTPSPAGPRPIVIGLGHPARHDDALGLDTIDRLEPRLHGIALAKRCTSEGTELLDLWQGGDLVVVVDAVRSGAEPGTVFCLEVDDLPLPPPFRASSTHGISLADVVALARSLDRLPRRLVIYGIEGERFEPGIGLSDRVAPAVASVVERVLRELEGAGPLGSPAGREASSHA